MEPTAQAGRIERELPPARSGGGGAYGLVRLRSCQRSAESSELRRRLRETTESRGVARDPVGSLMGDIRADQDRTMHIVGTLDPTARTLAGDVDPLPARGLGPEFMFRRLFFNA
jgi:hypothetical protein